MGLEQKMAGDGGAFRAEWLQYERRHMVAGRAQEEIGVDELALVPYLFVRVESWKGAAHGRSAAGEGIGPVAMRDAAIPVQMGAACLAKRGHQGAELRMHPAAVVALVIVFANDLPIRRDFVANGGAYPQAAQGIAPQPLRDAAQFGGHRLGLGRGQIQEHESTPSV